MGEVAFVACFNDGGGAVQFLKQKLTMLSA